MIAPGRLIARPNNASLSKERFAVISARTPFFHTCWRRVELRQAIVVFVRRTALEEGVPYLALDTFRVVKFVY